MVCHLQYIPKHLHTDNKNIIPVFKNGEKLFYRCKKNECLKPYDTISLYDISHNRDFGIPNKYPKEDVFYNLIEDDPNEKYTDLLLTVLTLNNIGRNSTFMKDIISDEDPNLRASILLKHNPLPCMYPHSVFEISINGIVVDKNNYKTILNKKNVKFKNLRSDIRQILTSIIQTGNIDSDEVIEIIKEP